MHGFTVLVVLIVTGFVVGMVAMYNQEVKTEREYVAWKKELEYSKGEYVKYNFDNRKGVVMKISRCVDNKPYLVRFNNITLNAPLLGGKVDIAPYSDIWVEPWEISKWQKD